MTEAIERLIPHRPPFLFVDRIVSCDERAIVTERTLRGDEPHFAGHFPGAPLQPGVLTCEACFQSGALLLAQRSGEPGIAGPGTRSAQTPVLTRIQDAKLRGMVGPGDTLRIAVDLEEALGGAFLMTGRVTCEGRRILRVRFMVALVEIPSGRGAP